MERYDEVLRLTAVSQESAGTTAEKFAVVVESIDYKINALKESMVGLWQDFINADLIKNIIDAGTAIVKFLDAFGAAPLQIAVVTAALAGVAKFGASAASGLGRPKIPGFTFVKMLPHVSNSRVFVLAS